MEKDLIAEYLGWLDDIMTDPGNTALFTDKTEADMAEAFRNRWRNENRLVFLNSLAARYGEDAVLKVIDRIIDAVSRRNWNYAGKKGDNSLEAFIRILWEPLASQGFSYTRESSGNVTRFTVNSCPMVTLAKAIGAEKWLYHMVCMTDGPSAEGFNDRIRFSRTQTLMEGHSICNHTYTVMD